LAKLALLQKRLSNKKKGSSNRNKARLKVAKLHARITDIRKDFLHKLSTKLINENQVIAVESLAVSNMLKTASWQNPLVTLVGLNLFGN
jgi:putative transposase